MAIEFATIYDMAKALKGRCVTLILGNGSKRGYREPDKVKDFVKNHVRASTVLYFGDPPVEEKPDVGMIHKWVADEHKSDVYMVQISSERKYGVPSFVKGVLWHDGFEEGPYKWGGVKDGVPQSNTDVWYILSVFCDIELKAYVLGGGPIATQELGLLRELHIPCAHIPFEPLHP